MSTFGTSSRLPSLVGLPVSATFILPFALYGSSLAYRTVSERVENKIYIESSGSSDSNKPSTSGSEPYYTRLARLTRAHANFSENVPLAFIVGLIAEMNGADKKVLSYAYATLFALRVAHADFGLIAADNGVGPGRLVGWIGTMAWVAGVGGWAAYLSKGYWGF